LPQHDFAVRYDPAGPEALPWHECLQLLASARVGRIVYSDQALPAVQPVDFLVDDETVVVRIRDGSRLARAVERAVVAFEVDDYDPAAGSGWSVTVVGECSGIEEPGQVERLSALVPRHWARDGNGRFVRISLADVTGRRLDPAG
jgi:nitroimidazol reductase NimA-like FMN-containing flavoprotein (pyridoxamine 5'-phosphate oxidase superfamily)